MAKTTDPVIVISPQYCAPNFVDLAVARKKKLLREGNFAVMDDKGNCIFKIKDKVLCFHDRRVLLDAAGNPILTLKGKIRTRHDRWQVFKGNSDESNNLIFSVKGSKKNLLDVFLADNTEEKVCNFNVNGNWLERSCSISTEYSNTIIAQLDKKNTIMSQVDADAFMVKVYPNVDHAFIVSLIVLLDAIFEPRNNQAEVALKITGLALDGLGN